MYEFSATSRKRLNECDDRLIKIFEEVQKHTDCTVLCGHRNKEDQEKAFSSGNSKAHYGQSKHNYLPSCAVDVMPYPIDWNDLERVKDFAALVKEVAVDMGIEIRWGGDFKGFFDGPHFELVDTSRSTVP